MTKKVKKIKNENSYLSAYPYRPTYPISLKHVTPGAVPRRIFILLNQY